MYYTNIGNEELKYFHNLKVHNFTITLSDMLSSDLFKIEVVNDNLYKIYPLFYTNEITHSNPNDIVLDNKVIICQKLDNETYFSFISNPNEPIYDYAEYGSYFDIGDELTTNQFNGIISMLRHFVKHEDKIKIKQGRVKGEYGEYILNVNGTTVTDMGILITEETITNLGTVRLENNVFSNSKYTLHLRVYHMTDINISGEVSRDNIVYEDLEVELVPHMDITIPFSQLDYDYVIGFNANVIINHDVPIIIDYDLLFEDKGVTGDNNLIQWFYSPTYSSASVDESGTTFTVVREGSYATVSATLTQNPSSTDIYIYSLPLTVEFDLIGWEDNQGATTDYARIRVYNQANNKIAYWNVKDYGVGHYKIVCSNGSQKLYFNGVEQSRSFTLTPTSGWNVAFQTKGHIKYKNFIIKSPLV